MLVAPRSLRWIAAWVLTAGLSMRILPSLIDPGKPLSACDAWAYWELAKSLAAGHGLTNLDPALAASCIPPLGPSHHYSPLLPAIEAGFILLMGPNVWALATSQILLSVLLVGTAFLTTRDLFGRDAGLLFAAAVSVEWSSVVYGSRLAHAENLVLLTFILTLWGILRSLQDERFILWAGLFAGLGYLSKASMGWFFLVAGLGGLGWRLWHQGWATLRNRHYLGAIGIFGVQVAAWGLRNLRLFWDGTAAGLLTDWQTSDYNARAFASALDHPDLFLVGLIGKLPVLLWGIVLPLAAFWPAIRLQVREHWREEATSGLLLAAGLVFTLGWLFAGAYWVTERTQFTWMNNLRYVTPALAPLVWIALAREERAKRLAPWVWLYGFSFFEIFISRILLKR